MVTAIARMSIAEREDYVRWWMEESGLEPSELRRMAMAVWGESEETPEEWSEPGSRRRTSLPRRTAHGRRRFAPSPGRATT
jgi:hypothetical protein